MRRYAMTTIEKIQNKQPITREEFRELVKKTDWTDYARRVVKELSVVADVHERVRAKSLERASHHVLR